jgi:8-oxo-dGTP diphosphatase
MTPSSDATDLSSEGPLQFGAREPCTAYTDRPAAFGVAERDGRIALVKVARPEATWFDLPGGAIEEGEDEAAALTREFQEETGLKVEAGALLTRADQYFFKADGAPVNNRSAIYRVTVAGEDPALKTEPDHALEWWDPVEALTALRHDSHAWAVAAWMRAR